MKVFTFMKLLSCFCAAMIAAICLPAQLAFSEENKEPVVSLWDGTVDIGWYDEEETEYHISSAAAFVGFSQLSNDSGISFEDKNVYLDSDLNLDHKEILSLKGFKGTFDGGNHTIHNLDITGTGLFDVIIGTVQNINLNNVTLNRTYVHSTRSTIVLRDAGQDTINNIAVSEQGNIGIICGELYGNVKNCSVEYGTICINIKLSINYTYSGITSRISGDRMVGNRWNIDRSQINIGGICGKITYGQIEHCKVNLQIKHLIDKTQTEGNHFESRNRYGSNGYVSYANSITATGSAMGGIVGTCDNSTIIGCMGQNVSVQRASSFYFDLPAFGGVCGVCIAGRIVQCINHDTTNDAQLLLTKSGGICGSTTQSLIAYCYSEGNSPCNGGIIGNGDDNIIISVYNTLPSNGGVVASGTNILENCFYLSGVSSQDGNKGEVSAISKSEANLKKEEFAERLGFPFMYVEGEYPKLVWEQGEYIQMGDVNCDAAVNVADVVQLYKSLLTETELNSKAAYFADLDYDKRVSVIDLTLLKKMLLE